MDLNELMRNIRGIDVVKEIESAITQVKSEYNDLTTEQTCKIYSGLLYEKLNERHVPVRVVNTLGLTYEHMFLLVNSGDIKYYLIDLTYSQFKNDYFKELLTKGYQEITNENINKYLEIVSKDKTNMTLDELYYGSDKKGKSI